MCWTNIQLMLSQFIMNGSFIIKQAEPMVQHKQEAGVQEQFLRTVDCWTLRIDIAIFSRNSRTENFWGTRKCSSENTRWARQGGAFLNEDKKSKSKRTTFYFFSWKNASDTGQDLCPCISHIPTNPHPISLRYVQSHPFSPWVRQSAHGYFLPIHVLKTVRLIWQLGPKDMTTVTALMGWTWTYVRESTNGFLTCTCI